MGMVKPGDLRPRLLLWEIRGWVLSTRPLLSQNGTGYPPIQEELKSVGRTTPVPTSRVGANPSCFMASFGLT
jgi:hypothetical protein